MKKSALLIVIAATLGLQACSKVEEPTLEANEGAGAVQEASAEPKVDPRAPKEPGCNTLIEMGHLDRMTRVEFDSSKPAGEIIEGLKSALPTQDDSSTTQNRMDLNKCRIYQIHARNIADDRRQVIYTVLAEGQALEAEVTGIGEKYTCWSDANEQWRFEEPCGPRQ